MNKEEALRSALERVTANYRLTLAGKPVRDVTETLGEADAALSEQTQQGEALTDAQKRTLIGGFFAESWAVDAAMDLLHDYDRRLSAPHQGTEHPVGSLTDYDKAVAEARSLWLAI